MIKGIKYISYYGFDGYFNAAKKYMLALINMGIPLTWSPQESGSFDDLSWRPYKNKELGDKELDPYLNLDIPYDTVIVHQPPETYPWWIEHEPNKKIYGYTVWETNKIKPFWVGTINLVDGLIVPCKWNKNVFEEGGVTIPITVIPHLLNKKIISAPKLSKPENRKTKKEYVFYSINTWTDRKAIPKLIKAYLDEFSKEDPTCLIIKTTKFGESQPVRPHFLERILFRTHIILLKIRVRYKSPARIKLITKELKDDEIVDLHKKGDCYVSLTRAEGWGLGAYDAAAAGNPVLMTGFGGQLDFLAKEFSYLVNYHLVPVQYFWRGENFHPDQKWAEPDVEHASKLMRYIFENQAEAKRNGKELKNYVLNNFSEKEIIGKFISAIS